jgi:DNA primase catalytic core
VTGENATYQEKSDVSTNTPEVDMKAIDNPDDALKNNPHKPTNAPRREHNRTAGKRRSPVVQSVLDQIPIENEIGKDVQLRGSSKKFVGLCPFHNDTHPSFEVYPHTQSWFCYGCQKGGTLIDYVMYRDGLTPSETIRMLCEEYNIPHPSWTEKQKKEWEQEKEEKEIVSSINLATFKWYHDNMPQNRQEYYLKRGIVKETIDLELFGYAPDNDVVVGEMLKNYKAEQLVASGLFTVVKGCLEPIYKRRYVIPYWEECKIVYSIGRLDTDDPDEIAQLPEWNRGKYKKQLVHSEKHPEVSKVVKNVIWNADCVSDYSVGSIAEGIIDGILHKQISEEIGVGVISPVTTKFSSNDLEQLISVTSHWEKVYCIADNEVSEAGIKGAQDTAKTLFKAGRNPYIVLPPRPDNVKKVDLADYLNVPPDQNETRLQEFSQLLSSSPSLLDYLVKEAKKTEDTTKQDEQITEIVSLMVSLNPIKLERYKNILEEELDVKRGVFKSLFEQAKKEREQEERQQAQEELNQRTVNVSDGTPADERTPRRYGDVLETEDGYAQVTVNPVAGLQLENISSFIIKPKSRMWIDDYEAVSTDLVTASKRGSATALSTGKTYAAIFERQHWNELNAFMSRLPSIDLVWQGKLPEVQAVMGIVNSYVVPTQKGTRQIGWYNVGSEAEPKLIWVAKNININNSGFLDQPEILYCPYPGEMEIENAISFRDCDDATFQQLKERAKELVLINEPNAILPIIGWFFAVPFKWHFLNHPNYHHFPHLSVWGTRGSGKTETVKLLWRIFGYTGKEIPSASQTRFALLRMFTSTNSYPICLDEYKPYDMKAGSPEAVGHFMRLAYDGKVDARGRPDQSIVSYRLIAPACLIGESPLEETATLERIIPTVLSPSAIDKLKEGKERQSIFSKLSETNWEGFFMRYLRDVMNLGFGKDFQEAHDGARGRVLYYLNMRPLVPRILDNLVALQFGLERFAEFVGIPEDALDALMQECIINTANTLCGEGDVHSTLAVESMLEQLSIMAETYRLKHGVHYVVNEKESGEKEIYLRLSACLAEFRKFVRETNWQGEVMVDSAYRRQLREMMAEGKLVVDTCRSTRGWEKDKTLKAVVIVADTSATDSLDLSGFQVDATP